jgi:hypothetical protein
MNPGVGISEFMGNQNKIVKLEIDNTIISSAINRTANLNGSVRLHFGKDLSNWYQSNFKFGDTVFAVLEVTGEDSLIRLSRKCVIRASHMTLKPAPPYNS